MPSQHSIRLHKHQGRAPFTPPHGQHHPEESVSRSKFRSRDGALQGGQLLPKGHVLEGDRSMAAAGYDDRSEYDEDRGQHAGDRGVS